MTRKIFLTICLLFFCCCCFCQQEMYFEIKGVIENNYTGNIYLNRDDGTGNRIKETARVVNGRFYFKNKLSIAPYRAHLTAEDPSTAPEIYLDTGTILVLARLDSFVSNNKKVNDLVLTSITGSKSQALWDDMANHTKEIMALDVSDSIKSNLFFSNIYLLTKMHPDNIVASDAMDWISQTLTYGQLTIVFDNLSRNQQARANKRGIQKTLERLKKTTVDSAIYFPPQKDTSGKTVTLADLEYKYLLIDFWASWCGPCHEEHPGLVKLYNKYRSQGFEVISISFDTQKSDWIRSIHYDHLPWPQVSDLYGFYADIAKYYSLSFVPFNILIDRTGKIVDRDIRNDRLEKKINALFSN